MEIKKGVACREKLNSTHQMIDAILHADLAEICDEMCLAAPPRGIGLVACEATKERTRTYDVDIIGHSAATFDRDLLMAVISGDYQIGETEGASLKPEQKLQQDSAASKFRHKHLGRQIVMIEDKNFAEQPPKATEQPVRFWGIAGMEYVKAATGNCDAEREQRCPCEAPCEFEGESKSRGGVNGDRIAINVNVLESFKGGSEPFGLRADDADSVSCGPKRRGLEPDTAVEWPGQILYHNQNSFHGLARASSRKIRKYHVHWTVTTRRPH